MENNFISISRKDLSTIQRMLGQIEGAVYGIGKREVVVYDAVETINGILDKAEVERSDNA